MASGGSKSDAVRDILAFQMLAEDDDDIVLLANEGLRDLAHLGSERFAKNHAFCCQFCVEMCLFSCDATNSIKIF